MEIVPTDRSRPHEENSGLHSASARLSLNSHPKSVSKSSDGRSLKLTRKTPVQRLAERLEREHKLLVDVSTFERVYAGHWQRSSGAWSWFMYRLGDPNCGKQCVGSQFSVRQLLKAKALQVGASFTDIEVDPA